MVYHEIRKIHGKKYNYIIQNKREGSGWKKTSKYLGEEDISKDTVKKEIKKFKMALLQSNYLSKEQIREIENIRNKLNDYLKKSGKIGEEKFREWIFTELTYNSNAIEGNTLSLKDTSLVINENIIPKQATLREVYEAKNHKQALDLLKEHKGDLNERLILKIHSFILKDIADNFAGKYRRTEVRIKGSDFKPPKAHEVPLLVSDLIKWYKESKKELHPLELAVITSTKLVTIHPFIDGNGRVSRLIMNFILKKYNYPEINIYVKNRSEYLDNIRKANNGDYKDLIIFVFKNLEENYSTLLEKNPT